jgi:uncharacterized UPF0146 family protein
MLNDYKSFAEYIALNYLSAVKIVEVGIGNEFSVFEELKRLLINVEIIAVDIKENYPFKDDITKSKSNIYEGSDLIYSIRPNPELYTYLMNLASKVQTDLIIRPFSLDYPPEKGKLINYKKAVFFLFKN